MTPQVTDQVTPQVARVHFLKTHLESLLLAGWIERTIPDKPRSSKQKYRLTEKGRQALRKG